MRLPHPTKMFFIGLGWIFVALGLVGAFLPVMPTTPFMLLALWAFARSSQRFHDWLYYHTVFGPPLQKWTQFRVIPPLAKIMSVSMMSASFIYVLWFKELPIYLNALIFVFMALAAWYILSKPSHVPTDT